VRLGTGLIEKKVIQNSGPFRYAMLDTLSDQVRSSLLLLAPYSFVFSSILL
jgi:hypothetical protein